MVLWTLLNTTSPIKSENYWQRVDEVGRPFREWKVLVKNGQNRPALTKVKSIGKELTLSAGPFKGEKYWQKWTNSAPKKKVLNVGFKKLWLLLVQRNDTLFQNHPEKSDKVFEFVQENQRSPTSLLYLQKRINTLLIVLFHQETSIELVSFSWIQKV